MSVIRALLAAGAVAAGALGAPAGLRVTASSAVAPCVVAAAGAFAAGPVSVTTGSYRDADGDVFVGVDVEVTRALESGAAVIRSEADIATNPWVLVVESGNPRALRGTADLARVPGDVW